MTTATITPFFTEPVRLKTALLSVSDKTGITELATALSANGVRILSTGGTYKTLTEAGIAVTEVSQVTGFPECLDGRVKTLHPAIHAGILARVSHAADNQALQDLGISPIELVVVNLYPFRQTISPSGHNIRKSC